MYRIWLIRLLPLFLAAFLLVPPPSAFAQGYDVYILNKPLEAREMINKEMYGSLVEILKLLNLPYRQVSGSFVIPSPGQEDPNQEAVGKVTIGGKAFTKYGSKAGTVYVSVKDFASALGYKVVVNHDTRIVDVVRPDSAVSQKLVDALNKATKSSPTYFGQGAYPPPPKVDFLKELSQGERDLLNRYPEVKNYLVQIVEAGEEFQQQSVRLRDQAKAFHTKGGTPQDWNALVEMTKDYRRIVEKGRNRFAGITPPPQFVQTHASLQEMFKKLMGMADVLDRAVAAGPSLREDQAKVDQMDREMMGLYGELLKASGEYLVKFKEEWQAFEKSATREEERR